jgi:hypothetical protein
MKFLTLILVLALSQVVSAASPRKRAKHTLLNGAAPQTQHQMARAANACPIEDGKTFKKDQVSAFFFGINNWKQTESGSSNLSSLLKDGIVSSSISFGNLNGSSFSVKYWDEKDGKVKTATAPKSEIEVKGCSLWLSITYQGNTYPCEILRTGDKRIAARIGGFLHKTVYMAPANTVREQTEVPEFVPPAKASGEMEQGVPPAQ